MQYQVEKGQSELHFVAKHNDVSLIQTLMSHGADIDVKDEKGPITLRLAELHKKSAEILELFTWGVENSTVDDLARNTYSCDKLDFLNKIYRERPLLL